MNIKKIKQKSQLRSFQANIRANEAPDGKRFYTLTVSSELPVETYIGHRHAVEVLSHEAEHIDFQRADGMPLLLEHDRSKQIGVIQSLRIVDGKLEADIRFSRSAEAIEQDVADGIRRNVSIGYRVNKYVFEGVDGAGLDIYRATNWQPLEISIVSVPADPTVGVGRSDSEETVVEIENEPERAEESKEEASNSEAVAEKDSESAAEQKENKDAADDKEANSAADGTSAERSASQSQEASCDSVSAHDSQRAEANARLIAERANADADIVKLSTRAGHADKAADFIKRGLTVEQATQELFALTRTNSTQLIKEKAKEMNIDMKKYSFARALLVASGIEHGGYEAEVSEQLRSELAKSGLQTRGFLVPTVGIRSAMTAGGAGAGAELVATEHQDLIQAIYDKTVSSRLGVQFLAGLSGNLDFPREIPGLQAHWKGENPVDPAAESGLGFDNVTMSPKTLIATTSFSRQLLVQASESIEALVRNRLALEHSLAIDRALFSGDGNLQPLGIYNHPDVATVAIDGVPTYGDITDMAARFLAENTLSDNVKFVVTPEIAGKLAQTLTAQAAGAGFVWQGTLTSGSLAGYEAVATNLVGKNYGANSDEHGFIAGDFSSVMLGNWGTLEIIADPYTLAGKGLIKFTSNQFVDVGIRHGQGFLKAVGVKPV